MIEKLEDMQDNSYKNMQNPDFLWEIPDNVTKQHLVRKMQEEPKRRSGTKDDSSTKDSAGDK